MIAKKYFKEQEEKNEKIWKGDVRDYGSFI